MNSTHKVEVVPIVMEKHNNADTLSICNVFGGYTCVLRTCDWSGIELGAYIPPDSLVDTGRPEFSFLVEHARADGKHRVKAKKLRGVVSFGLMVPAPAGFKLGDDCAEFLGVEHYEPPLPGEQKAGLITGGEIAKSPDVYFVKYDVDAFRKYHGLFVPGEQVWVTEKIHGASARYVFHDEQMHCGSRNEWKKEFPDYAHITMEWLLARLREQYKPKLDEDPEVAINNRATEIFDKLHNKPKARNLWWNALTPEMEAWCRRHPNCVLYGEVYGQVQNLKYGLNGVAFAAFDIMIDGAWLHAEDARNLAPTIPWVPYIGTIPYSFNSIVEMSDGPSTVPGANHYREGCVVKPVVERRDPYVGRVCFKCVGGTYLEKDKG